MGSPSALLCRHRRPKTLPPAASMTFLYDCFLLHLMNFLQFSHWQRFSRLLGVTESPYFMFSFLSVSFVVLCLEIRSCFFKKRKGLRRNWGFCYSWCVYPCRIGNTFFKQVSCTPLVFRWSKKIAPPPNSHDWFSRYSWAECLNKHLSHFQLNQPSNHLSI